MDNLTRIKGSNERQGLSLESAVGTMPVMPTAVKDTQTTRELMFSLRHFHLGDPSAKQQLRTVGDDYLPALLNPFRDTSKLRYIYPLFLIPPETANGHQEATDLVRSLSDFFRDRVNSFAPDEESARILRDNLPWLERHIREHLRQSEAPVDAAPIVLESAKALQAHLKLDSQNQAQLQADFDRLVASIPEGGQLLGYGRFAAIHLLNHAIRSRVIPRRYRFQAQIKQLVDELRRLLDVEWSKSDESIEPKIARDSVGLAGLYFDPVALSSVMDHAKGTKAMPITQRKRIEEALHVLENWHEDPVLVHFVHLGKLANPWLETTPAFEAISDPDPCARATSLFDELANKLSKTFCAARIAQLEIDRIYDPAIHDPWFANFDWEAFSQEELLLIPAVIALESADRVAGIGLHSFSRLLNSGRPVHILVRVQAHNNPGAAVDEGPFQNYRTELGYLGIGHRQAVVSQSSPARSKHLLTGFLAALDATRTSLHIVNTGLRPAAETVGVPLNAWLVAGAALEGRAHPFFQLNPAADQTSAALMDFSSNPQPQADWPLYRFDYRDENGTAVSTDIAFTFADYALLIKRLRDHFRLIPAECDSDLLLPVDQYLALDLEEAYRRIPFVLAVDGSATLRRLVVSRELIMACRDRLNYWRTLQELAGVRNRYVEQAIEKTRTEEQTQAAAERERLQAQHAEALEEVRNEAAGEAMQRLTQVLLNLDLSDNTPAPAMFSPTPSARAEFHHGQKSSEPEEPILEDVEEEAIGFDEAWIDSLLCTSCNDCMSINPTLFVYNENKQAIIGDRNAGTFAQLVQAAESCPAHCIHPGKPIDSDEPGLDELIERAVPFNAA